MFHKPHADWLWVADVDEFPNIHVGDHSLPALIEACERTGLDGVELRTTHGHAVERGLDEAARRASGDSSAAESESGGASESGDAAAAGLRYRGAPRPDERASDA